MKEYNLCGISGFVSFGEVEHYQSFLEYFKGVNAALVQRGPDCFGMWGKFGDRDLMTKVNLKECGWEQAFDDYFRTAPFCQLVIANFRGIPTSEFLAGGKENDRIQPYHDRDHQYFVTHNGQLSNDDDLNKKYGYSPFTGGKDIDSYYFLRLLQGDEIIPRLREVEGSYAVAAFSKRTSTLYFMRSFKGLFFAIWRRGEDQYLVWASEKSALETGYEVPIVEMPINSLIKIQVPFYDKVPDSQDIVSRAWPIMPPNHAREKSCVVVLSGGMDSTVCLAEVVSKYQNIHLLHFHYGARAEVPETLSVMAIKKWFETKYPDKNFFLQIVDLSFIKNLGGSTLTDHSLQIAKGELAIETDHEWVPARNIAMIGLATSYCDRHNIGAIVLGLNMEEGGVFCDNSIEFYQRMEAALQLGSHSQPKLVMPVGNSMKWHIWRRGIELGAPLHLSWSCYTDGMAHGVNAVGPMRCGVCGPCSMRQRAAAMNGTIDILVPYVERDPVAMQIFNKVRSNAPVG